MRLVEVQAEGTIITHVEQNGIGIARLLQPTTATFVGYDATFVNCIAKPRPPPLQKLFWFRSSP